jgi:sugar lactone lactonase YvrE
MKVDAKGNLFITGRAISVYSPQGRMLGSIALPESARNCAFGDRDFKTLYITGRESLFRVRLETPGAIRIKVDRNELANIFNCGGSLRPQRRMRYRSMKL